jgi:hypothetical protein
VEIAMDSSGPREPGAVNKTPKKTAVASWIGSVLEYYDFFIYGTAAALVFGKVFFPAAKPATATLRSREIRVAYAARPIGGVFMGHLCDRHGRKRVLVLTVTLMGATTFLVECLPTYADTASGPRCYWSPCGCCKDSPRRASRRAPTRSPSNMHPSGGEPSTPASPLAGPALSGSGRRGSHAGLRIAHMSGHRCGRSAGHSTDQRKRSHAREARPLQQRPKRL